MEITKSITINSYVIFNKTIFVGIQALMGAASQSSEESPTSCDGTQKIQVLALARAVANSTPNPYDKDALKFNVCVKTKNTKIITLNNLF